MRNFDLKGRRGILREDEEKYLPNLFLKILTEEAVATEDYSSISQPSPEMPTLSSGDGP